MNNTILEYNDFVLGGVIELTLDEAYVKGAVPCSLAPFWKIQHTLNKMGVAAPGCSDLSYYIARKAERRLYYCSPGYNNIPKKGDTLFISSDCKIPRNILRNDYKITIKPDNADYTVIPQLSSYGLKRDCNIAVKYNDRLILFNVMQQNSYRDNLEEYEVTLVENALEKYFTTEYTAYYDTNMAKFYVFFPKKNKEIQDIVLNTYPSRKYIYESYLDYETPTKIDVESLIIWSKLSDELKEKAIVASNWREYPFTIYNFIRRYNMSYSHNVASFIPIRNYLDSYVFYDTEKNFISPKDWNMLQKWIFKLMGVPETGGVISFEKYLSLTTHERFVLNKRVAIKPIYLDETNNNNMRIGDILPQSGN